MKLTHKVLITIGREYGSGGRAIAEALGRDLDIPVLDKNMLSTIEKKHGLDKNALEASDERLSNPFFDPYSPYGLDSGAISERLFALQSDLIREQADKGSAVFVGRCANDVLRNYDDLVNIFIFAPKEERIRRIMSIRHLKDEAAAEKFIRRTDKTRRSYYQFYTDKKWGSRDGMDLMINSAVLGVEGTVGYIEDFLKRKGYLE